MTAHKHAALMALYAQDAMETDKPYERWEFRDRGYAEWRPFDSTHPSWHETTEYRRKPRTIRIGEYDVPEPVREAPEHGTIYWLVSTQDSHLCCSCSWWDNNSIDQLRLKRGLIHLTRKAAEQHGRALVSLTEMK